MLQPPVSDLAPWRPGHWITQTGYALDHIELWVANKDSPKQRLDKQQTVWLVGKIIERVIAK